MIVKFKPTGQLGTIDDKEFDPNIYEQVDSKTQQQTATPQTQIKTAQPKSQDVSTNDPLNPLNDYVKRVGYTPQQIMEFKRKDLAKGIPRADVEAYYKTYDPTEQEASAMSQYEKNKYKKDTAVKGIVGIIDTIEKNYMEANGGQGTGTSARIGGLKKDIAGKFGYNDLANIYNNERDAMTATLKQITGDSGVMTDEDRAYIKLLMPPLGATEVEAAKAWSDIRKFIADKTGGVMTETKFKGGLDPEVQKQGQVPQNLQLGFDLGKDKGQESFDLIQQANNLAKLSLSEKDPQKKADLLAKSRALSDIGSETDKKRVTNPLVAAGAKVQEFLGESPALPIAGGLLGQAIGGPVGAGVGAGAGTRAKSMLQRGGVESLVPTAQEGEQATQEALKTGAASALFTKILPATFNPKQSLGKLRTFFVENSPDVKIATKPVLQAAEGYLKDIPIARPMSKEILSNLSKTKNLSLPDALTKLERWGKLAYTKGGDPKSTAEAQLMNIIYGQVRKQIAEKAKAVSTVQNMLSTVNKIGGLGNRVVGGITTGAGIAGGAAILGKLGLKIPGFNAK